MRKGLFTLTVVGILVVAIVAIVTGCCHTDDTGRTLLCVIIGGLYIEEKERAQDLRDGADALDNAGDLMKTEGHVASAEECYANAEILREDAANAEEYIEELAGYYDQLVCEDLEGFSELP